MTAAIKNLNPMRNDFEVIRALALTGMLIYHFAPSFQRGGYVTVDVFFVLSGYVVTLNLSTSLKKHGSIWGGMLDFWARRCKRLLPNAMLVIASSMIAAWLLLGPVAIQRAATDAIWAAGFAANWQFTRELHDYFAEHSITPRLTIHFWSLATEEQFFVAWPILMAGLGLYSLKLDASQLKNRLRLLCALAGLSFLGLVYETNQDLRQAYFNSLVRAWEFLCGAILALRQPTPLLGGYFLRRNNRLMIETTALLAIGAAAYWFDPRSSLRAWSMLVPVFATMVLIEVGRTEAPVLGILKNRVLVAMGRRSYSMYLWHWPVLILTTHTFQSESPIVLSFAFVMSLILAQLGWRYVEVPARYTFARSWSSKRVLLSAGLCILAMFCGLLLIRASNGTGLKVMQAKVDSSFNLAPAIVTQNDRPLIYKNGCHLASGEVNPKACRFGDSQGKGTAVLLGNSLAAQWFSPIESAARNEGIALLTMTKSSCPVLDVPHIHSASIRLFEECRLWLENSLGLIDQIKPKFVIVSGVESPNTLSQQRDGSYGNAVAPSDLQTQIWSQSMERVLSRIQKAGAIPVILRHTPIHRPDVLDCLYTRGPATCTVKLSEINIKDSWEFQVAEKLGIKVWDFNKEVCPQGVCESVSTLHGLVTYSDSVHLRDSFARKLEPLVLEKWKSSFAHR
jgi:peptidoglycan/LPS O-acetylase OafA/YrhL